MSDLDRDALRSGWEALAANVDRFFAAAAVRGGIACAKGCDGCCRVELEVGLLEADRVEAALAALPPAERARLAERAGAPEVTAGTRCVFLEDEGSCAVYAGRPLVCRSQGLALAYALGEDGDAPDVPLGAILGRAGAKAVVACPLCYGEGAPAGAAVLDADRVDEVLARLQLAWARAEGAPPLARVSLRVLARRASTVAGVERDG